MADANLTSAMLNKMVDEAHFTVVSDLGRYAEKLGGPLRKAEGETMSVKEEPDEEKLPDAEILMSKSELVIKHGLVQYEKGAKDKAFPFYCPTCRKVFCGRNRAKILQHVGGKEHIRKALVVNSGVKQEVKQELDDEGVPVAGADEALVGKGRCHGLKLNSSHGQNTRLGSDLKPCWQLFAEMSSFSSSFLGTDCHLVTHLKSENDWVIRHSKCSPDTDQRVEMGDNGEGLCKFCLELGSSQRFLCRVCDFVFQVHMVSLLHKKMFQSELVDAYIAELKQHCNYVRRKKTQYDLHFNLDCSSLHQRVRSVWYGRSGHTMNECLQQFYTTVVSPCLEVEPGAEIKSLQLEKVLDFMRSEEGTTNNDIQLVKAIVSHQVHRHPVLHGVISACMCKLDCIEKGKKTFRNPKRYLSLEQGDWAFGWTSLMFLDFSLEYFGIIIHSLSLMLLGSWCSAVLEIL